MEIIKENIGYHEILFKAIENMCNYHTVRGGEGTVYFVDENFILKEYTAIANELIFDGVFDNYCKECQEFAEKGYNVPKIYAWAKIPNEMYSMFEPEYRYFVLEERVKGKELYPGSSSKYELYEDVCSYSDFFKAYYDKKDLNLLNKLMQTYCQSYLSINEKLYSLDEKQLESFIMTIYKMHVESIYSTPDVYYRNIIFDGDANINLIDNAFNHMMKKYKTDNFAERAIFDIVKILNINQWLKEETECISDNDISMILDKNRKICNALLQKIIKIINKNIDKPIITNVETYDLLNGMMIAICGEDDGLETMSMLQSSL